MDILLLTLFISVLLALVFLLMFLAGRSRRRHLSSPESDALLPFADDRTRNPNAPQR